MARRYRLNVDFDNSVVPFLYNTTGEFTFTVPSSPNFMDTRYVVFLPCAILLTDAGQRPVISGYTRIETGIPSTNEFRTIPVANYDEYFLKDALEFPADSAGATLTVTNLWTIGSTVDPDGTNSYSDDRKGCQVYTRKSTGVDTDLNVGTLHIGEGFIVVNGSEIIIDSEQDIVPGAALTASLWHIVYMDTAGIISFEETTASDYSLFPISVLDSLAPVNSQKTGRYKVDNGDMRAIAAVYTLPEQSDYNSGTTYSRTQKVVEGTTVYNSRVSSNIGHTPSSSPTYWLEMGAEGYLFNPKVYNFPESIFGTGALGDVTLDGTGLGATATPLFGVRENVTGTIEYYPEYEFNNLTITGVCYAGKSNGLSLDPVVIRVKGTLTIGASGQINGDARGANGGAGGTAVSGGVAGTAGGKSGRPIHIYANKIVCQRTSGYWITTQAGNGSDFSGIQHLPGTGAGSSSGIKIITNSNKIDIGLDRINYTINSRAGKLYSTNFSSYVSGVLQRGGENGNPGYSSKESVYLSLSAGDGGEGGGTHGSQSATGGKGGKYSSGIMPGGGGGSFGCGGGASSGSSASTGGDGQAPAIPHENLNYIIIIDQYDSREAI